MLMTVKSVLKTFLDLFVVTQPKLNVELLRDTSGAGGAVFRITEPSGVYRDVYVLREWEKDEKTGEDIAVKNLANAATGYVDYKIDYVNLSARKRPSLTMVYKDEPLSVDDHNALVDFFETQAKNSPSKLRRKILCLYPSAPNGDTGKRHAYSRV